MEFSLAMGTLLITHFPEVYYDKMVILTFMHRVWLIHKNIVSLGILGCNDATF